MRYCITLKPNAKTSIAFNYNYPVYASIVRALQLNGRAFYEYLRKSEFNHLGSNVFRNFNFSVRFSKVERREDRILISDNPVYLYLSSPIWDQYLHELIESKLKHSLFSIMERDRLATFTIESVRVYKEPEISDEMKFKLMSPLVLSYPKLLDGKLRPYYLRFDDDPEEINRLLTQSLYKRFRGIHPKLRKKGKVEIIWDNEYIDRKLSRGERVSKKITITSPKIQSQIIGIEAPFTIKGDPHLIKIGYQCGFGDKTHLGFGMADVVREHLSSGQSNT